MVDDFLFCVWKYLHRFGCFRVAFRYVLHNSFNLTTLGI